MNRNKNLLILYYLWKNLSKFSIEQKKVFHTLSFQLCSTASSKSSFNVSLWKIHYFKIQTISLVSKSIYFSRYSLCFIYFDVSFASYWKKLQTNWFFFQSHEYNKNLISCNNRYWMLRDLILQSHDFQSLKDTHMEVVFVFLDSWPSALILGPRLLVPSRRSSSPKMLQEQSYE